MMGLCSRPIQYCQPIEWPTLKQGDHAASIETHPIVPANADRRQPRRNRREIPPTIMARVRSARHHENATVLLGQERIDQHGCDTSLATIASHNQCPKLAAAVWVLPELDHSNKLVCTLGYHEIGPVQADGFHTLAACQAQDSVLIIRSRCTDGDCDGTSLREAPSIKPEMAEVCRRIQL